MDFYGIVVLKEVFLEKNKDVRDFWFVKPDANMITLTFDK